MKKRKDWSRNERRLIHHLIVRKKVFGTANRPRISIFFSMRWLTCQIINDDEQKTIIGASVPGKNTKQAIELATKISQKIKDSTDFGPNFYFDRSGYKFTGRVRAFAEQLVKEGLSI